MEKMNIVVIYKSKTGFVKKYAEWIATELDADIYEYSQITSNQLVRYNTIIYGGGVYISGINGVKLITENFDKIKNHNIIVFASGASPYREDAMKEVYNANFNKDQQTIRLFYLRGGFDFNSLRKGDRLLMILVKLKLKFKSKLNITLTPDEKGMLAGYSQATDFTRKKNIEELVAYVNTIAND